MFAIMYQFFLDKLFSEAVSTKLNVVGEIVVNV